MADGVSTDYSWQPEKPAIKLAEVVSAIIPAALMFQEYEVDYECDEFSLSIRTSNGGK